MARILVVDDTMVMRIMIRRALEEAGHQVVAEASNGNEAFKQYIFYKPDLVTMDLTMPEVNGVDAVGMIKGKFPDAVIIMVSAITQKDLILKAIAKGAKGYIIKPFEKEKLLETVNKALNINPADLKRANNTIDSNTGIDTSKIKGMDDAINSINKSIKDIDKSIDKLDKEK